MKKGYVSIVVIGLMTLFTACNLDTKLVSETYETSASGNKLTLITSDASLEKEVILKLHPDSTYQEITGFGGAFTESSAYLLNQLSAEKRNQIIEAYFSSRGANYSLTRTHINSCDFSLGNYDYAPVANDKDLVHFTIEEDRDDLIPMIKEAMLISEDGFKILASPWTAPPWMKDNDSYVGGKLLPEYADTWALYFSKYINAYKEEGIEIWGLTAENEPLGNNNNWESMHFSAEEMRTFVNEYLGPRLEKDGHQVKILGYDQNRGKELKEWASVLYKNESSAHYFDGMAVHWYASTYDWFPESLNFTHAQVPGKYLINTEACVDAEVPHWKEDAWYWKKEASDWGWDWAGPDDKHLHPKYVPVYRYARDIIGCMNSWVDGWIDWNMVLDKQGGPNWAKNWCLAPVIVDPANDEVYYTPLYYTMAHFSKYIRPGARRIGFENSDNELMITAAQNPDGSIALVVLNMTEEEKGLFIQLGDKEGHSIISAQAIQTILIENKE